MELTAQQTQKKEEILKKREAIDKAREELRRLLQEHSHTAERRDDSAVCTICGARLGWGCDKSPDGVCHYFTELDPNDDHVTPLVKLIDGSSYTLTDPYNLKQLNYQTHDRCLFCGWPEERS